MTSIHWPELLPAPLISEFNLSPVNLVQRTPFISGPIRARQEFADGPIAIQLAFVMTADQFSLFTGFLAHEINQGAAAFLLRLNLGNGYRDQEVMFTSDYQSSPLSGGTKRVSIAAVALRRDIISSEQYQFAKIGITAEKAERLRVVANEDYPDAVEGFTPGGED